MSKKNTCEKQPSIDGCDTYLQKNGYCAKCNKNSFLFLTPKKCIKTIKIDKCKEFKSRESCRLCEDEYYPTNYGQRCLPIPVSKNCLKWGPITDNASYDENNCLKCKPGFLLINKTCKKWFQSISQSCIQADEVVDGLRTKIQCKYCDITGENVLNKNVDSVHGVCVEDDLLKYYSSSLTIPNCVSYSWDNTNKELKCQKCADQYFLFEATNYNDSTSYKKCLTWSECTDKNSQTVFAYAIQNWLGTVVPTSDDITFGDYFMTDMCKAYSGSQNFLPSEKYKCLIQPAYNVTLMGNTTNNIAYKCAECPADKPIVFVKSDAD